MGKTVLYSVYWLFDTILGPLLP